MYDINGDLVDRRELLRVKVKHLACEARIIRREERKQRGILREQLHNHRVNEVRNAARAAQLAYGLICGRTLDEMEPRLTVRGLALRKRWMKEIRRMCGKYGPFDNNLAKAA